MPENLAARCAHALSDLSDAELYGAAAIWAGLMVMAVAPILQATA